LLLRNQITEGLYHKDGEEEGVDDEGGVKDKGSKQKSHRNIHCRTHKFISAISDKVKEWDGCEVKDEKSEFDEEDFDKERH